MKRDDQNLNSEILIKCNLASLQTMKDLKNTVDSIKSSLEQLVTCFKSMTKDKLGETNEPNNEVPK